MTTLFLIILNMSITASYVAIAVIIARLLLKRVPKIYSYMLWSAVLIRLVIPISFHSGFSLLRLVRTDATADTGFMEYVSQDMGRMKNPVVDAGIREIGRFLNTTLSSVAPIAKANPLQLIMGIGSMIWFTGAIVLLFYSVISYLKILAKVRTATLVKDNVYETDQIDTPFVFGFIKPKIYIPTGLGEHELSYILLHEQTHIKRRDYLIKPFAYALLIIHWFNPLMWLAYALMSKDMEMSCDERVVDKMGDRIKEGYSTTLLSLSISRGGLLNSSPLAFGESNVKARIKNILAYRQPSSWVVACSFLIIAALVTGCTANPMPFQQSVQLPQKTFYSGYDLDKLMKNKTLYVGNAGKVGGLISGMPIPSGIEGKGMELQTKAEPYGLTVNYEMNDSAKLIDIDALSGEIYKHNSIMLLSLIDNVFSITYSIVDNTGQNDGETHTFTLTRDEVDKLLGEDVRRYGADETSVRQLIDRLDNLTF